MNAEFYKKQIDTVLLMCEQGKGDQASTTSTLNPADYLNEDLFRQEKAMFQRVPLLVGHSSEIEKAGDFVVRELSGRSWVFVRGKDGQARAMLNYCQHRGTKLIHQASGQCKHRFVCPYHAWTYASTGELIGVPRADLFPGFDKSTKPLKQGHLEEAFGLLWLTQDTGGKSTISPVEGHGSSACEAVTPVASYLDQLAIEFGELNLQDYHLYFDKTRQLKAN